MDRYIIKSKDLSKLPDLMDAINYFVISYELLPESDILPKNGTNGSRVNIGLFALLFGLIGSAGAYYFQYWASSVDYRINAGSMSFFAWQPALPAIFEIIVLFAAIGCIIGFLINSRLPNWTELSGTYDNQKKTSVLEIILFDLNGEVKQLFEEKLHREGIEYYLSELRLGEDKE
jgi:hypothetical protein